MPRPPADPGCGLLEQPVLRVRPWKNGSCTLLTSLGEIIGYTLPTRPFLWWPGRARLAVFEQEESPLVFTIERGRWLFWRQEVRDADEELIGVISGGWIFDRFDHQVIRIIKDTQGGTMLTPGGRLLGRWTREMLGTELHFAGEAMFDPFARMLLLAAVLQP